jgi:Sulfotransferase domain
VRAVTKAQNRLVLELKSEDGWEPLCKFLGKDVPDEPYPYVNDGDTMVNANYGMFWGRLMNVTLEGLFYLAPIALADGVSVVLQNKALKMRWAPRASTNLRLSFDFSIEPGYVRSAPPTSNDRLALCDKGVVFMNSWLSSWSVVHPGFMAIHLLLVFGIDYSNFPEAS